MTARLIPIISLGLTVAMAAAPAGAQGAPAQDCAAWASQQTGYDPARAPQAQAQAQTGAAAKGRKLLGKVPVTTLIGGPKSIAMGAATGLAGSQLAKSGGVVGDAASGAANVMSKVPIPTTQEVVDAAGKTMGAKTGDQAEGEAAAYERARAACLEGKTQPGD